MMKAYNIDCTVAQAFTMRKYNNFFTFQFALDLKHSTIKNWEFQTFIPCSTLMSLQHPFGETPEQLGLPRPVPSGIMRTLQQGHMPLHNPPFELVGKLALRSDP